MPKIVLDDIIVNYKQEGSGNTVIFIHGLSDNLNYWNRLTDSLCDEFEVISYDLRGHGLSSFGDNELTVDLLVRDLNNLICNLNIENAALIGFSLGGHVALKYVLKYPNKVNSLIILSSSAEVDNKFYKRFEEFYNALNIGFEEFYDVIIKYVLPDDLLLKHKDKLEVAKKEAFEISNVDVIKQYVEMGKYYNISHEVHNINVPTLIVAGEEDDITDVTLQNELHQKISDSKMIVFENTKHNILIGRNFSKVLSLIKNNLKDPKHPYQDQHS